MIAYLTVSTNQMSNSSNTDYYSLGNSVSKNIHAFVGLIGIICNIISICVFERKQLKRYSYSIYWKTIAVFDSLILLYAFRYWVSYFLKFDIDVISQFFCRFNKYQSMVAGMISMWLECLITIDRFFTIVYPNRFKIVKKRYFQITVISLIIVYSLAVNITYPLNYRLEQVNGTLICHVPFNAMRLHWIIGLVNILLVTIFINPFLDLRIICHIFSTRSNLGPNRFTSIDRKFALSAIVLNVNSLLFKLGFVLGNLISMYLNLSRELTEMIFSICLNVTLIEKSDIFFVNMIANSIFRQEFLLMIGLGKRDNSSRLESVELLSSKQSSKINVNRKCSSNKIQQ